MKKISTLLIIFVILMFFGITIYKYTFYNKKDNIDLKFITHALKDNYMVMKTDDSISDIEKYKDNIIEENVFSSDFYYIDDKESINGEVLIDNNKYLYIVDKNKREKYKLSNIKFKTLYTKNFAYSEVAFFLISEDFKLYMLKINSIDIKKAIISKIETPFAVKNFTNLEFNSDYYRNGSNLFVLSDKGKINDVSSVLKYDENIMSIYNKYYVFGDNTMTNVWGNILKDKNNIDYKMKFFFVTKEEVIENNNNRGLIITDDDRLIYLDDTNKIIYEYHSKIKNINYEGRGYPQEGGKLTITFENKTSLSYTAACTNYYCIKNYLDE